MSEYFRYLENLRYSLLQAGIFLPEIEDSYAGLLVSSNQINQVMNLYSLLQLTGSLDSLDGFKGDLRVSSSPYGLLRGYVREIYIAQKRELEDELNSHYRPYELDDSQDDINHLNKDISSEIKDTSASQISPEDLEPLYVTDAPDDFDCWDEDEDDEVDDFDWDDDDEEEAECEPEYNEVDASDDFDWDDDEDELESESGDDENNEVDDFDWDDDEDEEEELEPESDEIDDFDWDDDDDDETEPESEYNEVDESDDLDWEDEDDEDEEVTSEDGDSEVDDFDWDDEEDEEEYEESDSAEDEVDDFDWDDDEEDEEASEDEDSEVDDFDWDDDEEDSSEEDFLTSQDPERDTSEYKEAVSNAYNNYNNARQEAGISSNPISNCRPSPAPITGVADQKEFKGNLQSTGTRIDLNKPLTRSQIEDWHLKKGDYKQIEGAMGIYKAIDRMGQNITRIFQKFKAGLKSK